MKGCKWTIYTSQGSLSNKGRSDLQFYQLKRWRLFLPAEEERFQPPSESGPPRGARSTAASLPPNIWRHDMGSDPWSQRSEDYSTVTRDASKTRRGDEKPKESNDIINQQRHGGALRDPTQTDLAGVVVDDEALVPAVEVLVRVDLDAELLQHRLVGALAHRVHGGAHVIEDAHDARGILPSQRGRFTRAQTPLHQRLIGSAQYLWGHSCPEGRGSRVHLALDEIADDLVVEVLDGSPLDAFLHVLLLRRRPE